MFDKEKKFLTPLGWETNLLDPIRIYQLETIASAMDQTSRWNGLFERYVSDHTIHCDNLFLANKKEIKEQMLEKKVQNIEQVLATTRMALLLHDFSEIVLKDFPRGYKNIINIEVQTPLRKIYIPIKHLEEIIFDNALTNMIRHNALLYTDKELIKQIDDMANKDEWQLLEKQGKEKVKKIPRKTDLLARLKSAYDKASEYAYDYRKYKYVTGKHDDYMIMKRKISVIMTDENLASTIVNANLKEINFGEMKKRINHAVVIDRIIHKFSKIHQIWVDPENPETNDSFFIKGEMIGSGSDYWYLKVM